MFSKSDQHSTLIKYILKLQTCLHNYNVQYALNFIGTSLDSKAHGSQFSTPDLSSKILSDLITNVKKIPSGKGNFDITNSYLWKLALEGKELLNKNEGYFVHQDMDKIVKALERNPHTSMIYRKYYYIVPKSMSAVEPVYD